MPTTTAITLEERIIELERRANLQDGRISKLEIDPVWWLKENYEEVLRQSIAGGDADAK